MTAWHRSFRAACKDYPSGAAKLFGREWRPARPRPNRRLRKRTHADIAICRTALLQADGDEERAVALVETLQLEYLVERSHKPLGECRAALNEAGGVVDRALKSLMAVEEGDYVRQRVQALLDSDQSADDKLENLLALVWRQNMTDMAPAERVVALVGMLHNQLRYGGFQQYFFTIGAHRVPETLQALQEIGADRTALFLREAARVTAGERTDTPLETLDQELAKEPDGLANLALGYILVHRLEIGSSNCQD